MNMMGAKPIIEILPKPARRLQSLKILIGGHKYAGI
jgi:hypothetical protein